MISKKVILENVLGSSKNKWWILKIFNVIICCVFHNYCEMWKIPTLGHLNDVKRKSTLQDLMFTQTSKRINEDSFVWTIVDFGDLKVYNIIYVL